MAFDKEPLRITPNGLNLVQPVDQVAPGDCLELTGWFAGSVGKLEQARGWVQKNATGVAVALDSIGECNGRVYYGGAGNLYQVGRDTGAATIDNGFDGQPLGLCAFQGLEWVMNRSLQDRDDGTQTTTWGTEVPAAPATTQGTLGALVDGVHVYYVTFTDIYGYESNPCAEQDITVSNGGANDGDIVFTRAAAGAPLLIAGWNLYRQSPLAAAPYQVNAGVPIAYATTSYTDYGDLAHGQDDTTLIADDLVLEADHDPPPAASVLASVPYNGRMVAANSAAHPTRVWFTEPDQPNHFPGSGNPQAGNWVDIQAQSGDRVLHISVKVGYLVIYLANSIWQHTGDLGSSTAVLSPLIPNMGVAGPRAVVGTSQGDLALVRQGINYGIYRVTDWEQRIGAKVEPILRGLATECYAALNAAASGTIAVGYSLGRLWVSYPDGSNTTPSRTLLYDVEQDSVSFSVSGRWFSRAGGMGAFYHGSLFFLGTMAGAVLSLDDGTGDENGGFVSLAYQSGYMDSGEPDNEKTYGDLVINHNTGGTTLDIDIRRNKNADAFTLATFSSTVMTREIFQMVYPASYTVAGLRGLPIEAFNISIRIYGNGPKAFPGAVIEGPMILHHFLKPPRAMTWDSGPTDHGMQGVKEIDRFEVDIDQPTASTLLVWTDLPSDVVTAGTPHTIPLTTGRQIVPVVLAAPLQGRILRYQIVSAGGVTGSFLLYRFRVRAVPLGVWVDGSAGDSWYARPMSGEGK